MHGVGMRFHILRGGALAACMCACALPATAWGRVGEADVREGPRGGPCFTISPREEKLGTPDFQAVTVSDEHRLMWKMSMPPGRSFPLTFAVCVPYGGRVAALPRSVAADLDAGKVYLLRIDARAPAGHTGHAATVSYEARFCLARQRNGQTVVHQILDGDREGRHLYGCLPERGH